jgi:hypothetical protein
MKDARLDKIREKISGMEMRKMIQMWRNSLGIIADFKKLKQHAIARKIVAAINDEWNRRSRTPIRPDQAFAWPSTYAPKGYGGLSTDDWTKEGLLNFMGYKVGNTEGESQRVRELILAEIFNGSLPPVFPKQYMQEWGLPSFSVRLQKLAEAIAAFTRNAKRRRDSIMYAAISDWERDLEYLYLEYYIGKFRFAWPVNRI